MQESGRKVEQCIDIPSNASSLLRERLGLEETEPLRIAYIPGPGDVYGTFDFWSKDKFDPRVPVIAYSTQFYTLVHQLKADALIFHEREIEKKHDNQFFFKYLSRKRKSKNKLNYLFNNFIYSVNLLVKLYRFKPNIVVFSTDIPTVFTLMIPRKWNPVLTAHNTYWNMGEKPKGFKKVVKYKIISQGLKKITSAVCTSKECARQIWALAGNSKELFVQIPQLLEQYRHKEKALQESPVRNILFVGRIEKNKGIFDLLEAFEALSMQFPDLQLSYVGSGSYEKELAIRVNQSRARVRFLGRLLGDEVHKLLQDSDILVCPTRSDFNEGLAMVCIEAAINNVPSIVSSIVPAKELLKGGIIVFPVDDVDSLHLSLKNVINNPANLNRLRQHLHSVSQQFFEREKSWGSMLYKAMLKGK